MNKMQIFNSPVFGQVRTIEEAGTVLFCANDIAKALGYTKPRNAVAQHCRGAVKHSGVSHTTNQHGKETAQVTEMNFIPEGDVYRLIVRSKLPSAEKFERWVMDEVLPEIRQTGGYGNQQIVMEQMAHMLDTMSGIAKSMVTITQRMDKMAQREDLGESLQEVPRRRNRHHSIITHLDPELKRDVEEMLCSTTVTHSDIVKHLEDYGVKISMSSVCRYAKMMHLS